MAAEDERSVDRRAPEGDRLGQRVGVSLKEGDRNDVETGSARASRRCYR